MIDSADLQMLANFADMAAILVAISILLYGLTAGYFKQKVFLTKGGVIISAGIVVAVIAYLFDPALQHAIPELTSPRSGAATASHWAFDHHWVLSRFAFVLVVYGLVVFAMERKSVESDLDNTNVSLLDLADRKYTADQRFGYLCSSTTDAVYCYEYPHPVPISQTIDKHTAAIRDARLCHANEIFVAEREAEGQSGECGQSFGELDFANDTAAFTNLVTSFVEQGFCITDYELNYKTVSGEDRAYRVNLIGEIRKGRLERIWGIESNILETRIVKEELSHRQNFQMLIADISAKFVTASNAKADDIVRECMGMAARFVGAERSAMFWSPGLKSDVASAEYLWTSAGVKPIPPRLTSDAFPGCWQMLRDGQIVRIDDVSAVSETFAVDSIQFARFGTSALLILPLIFEGETVGTLSFSRVGDAQAWSDRFVADVAVFSELLAGFVLRLKSRRELAAALSGLQRATSRLQAENVYLREEVELTHAFHEIIGDSPAILRCLKQVENVTVTDTAVLILGETGTGKELVARAIHEHSDRHDRPMVKVNCAALPANLIESELFGHEKGAFTGAEFRKRGRFDLADGSTLFLDEIGELPVELQAKLLRVLQDGEFERLGGTKTIKVDVRIVVATNRDLDRAVREGSFRSDLYYRINTFPIDLPPLRERGDDIELLARHFVKLHAQRLCRDVQEISAEMMRQLRAYTWPGNIRELDGIIQRALISSDGPVANLAELLVDLDMEHDEQRILSSTIADLRLVEREHIVAALDDTRWKISGAVGAASRLGIPPSTLRSKMKKLGIARPR